MRLRVVGRRDEGCRVLEDWANEQRLLRFALSRCAVFLSLDQRTMPLSGLERAYDQRAEMDGLFVGRPRFDPLRADPRLPPAATDRFEPGNNL